MNRLTKQEIDQLIFDHGGEVVLWCWNAGEKPKKEIVTAVAPFGEYPILTIYCELFQFAAKI